MLHFFFTKYQNYGITETTEYEYDDYGNCSKMTATGTEDYVTEYSYNDSNGNYTALLQKEVKTVEKENELDITNNVKQTVYTYDANGNQIKKTVEGKTETYTYDGLNQLIGFTNGETTASYKYNASGLRYEKTVNGETVNHVWDGSKQIVADVIDNQFYEADCYIRGTNLVAKYNYCNGEKTKYTYYTQNAHGDVVNLTDETGKVIKTYKYDAFGVEKNIDDSDTNAFRYCGEYYDTETGTIYLRARYYNPSTGRFISRDSFAGRRSDPLSLNLYTYCRNNPIRYVDPSGHDAVEAAAFMVNNPKPTSVNSASDGKRLYEWNNKFKELLNRPAYVNSSSDAALYTGLRDKVTSPPSFKVNSNSDAYYYKRQMAMHETWKSLCPKPTITSPVKHSDYRNDAPSAAYGSSRWNGVPHGGIDFYPVDSKDNSMYGSDGTSKNVYAMANGEVVAYTSTFIGTDAIIVNHGDYFALYGEIATELRVGDKVTQGQILGSMTISEQNTLMLHLEILIDYPASSGFLGGIARQQYQIDPTYVYDFPDF